MPPCIRGAQVAGTYGSGRKALQHRPRAQHQHRRRRDTRSLLNGKIGRPGNQKRIDERNRDDPDMLQPPLSITTPSGGVSSTP